jgi:predicted 3-demethylubiquinone-9 3-methyltransferase (glyoxalase superfamily)
MSLGMCYGVCLGASGCALFGSTVFPDNIAVYISCGVSFGISIGILLGMAIGATKDKRISEKMMMIKKIEEVGDSLNAVIYVNDKYGVEKQYTVTEKKLKKEKLAEGDRVFEENNGSLVSLERK